METILTAANITLAIILIILVLFQRSEGGALGLGLSQDNFASTRSVGNFLTKSTAIVATLFIICSNFTFDFLFIVFFRQRKPIVNVHEQRKCREVFFFWYRYNGYRSSAPFFRDR